MKINVHSVYFPREHIIFLEEWLLYHMWTGIDHFYLYDNTGSSNAWGRKDLGWIGERDRRGYSFKSITSHLTDSDIQNIQKKIFKKYSGLVTHVKWQPRHHKFPDRIVFGQTEAIKDYVSRYSDTADWTYFFDMDEFFYSPAKKTLRECVLEQEEAGMSKLVIRADSFLSRYKLDDNGDTVVRNKYASQIFSSLGHESGIFPKQIIRCKDLLDVDKWPNRWAQGIHFAPLKPGRKIFSCGNRQDNFDYARYNHYNIPDEMIDRPADQKKGYWINLPVVKSRRQRIEKKFPNGIEDMRYDDDLSYVKPKLDKINMVVNEYIDIF